VRKRGNGIGRIGGSEGNGCKLDGTLLKDGSGARLEDGAGALIGGGVCTGAGLPA
jgi:hypothetical protein